MSRRMRWIGLLLVASLVSPAVVAHKLAPSLLSLHEQGPGEFDVSWKTPRFAATPVPIEPRLPKDCREVSERQWAYEGTGVRIDWKVRCVADLRGRELRVVGLAENQSAALLRIELRDSKVLQGMVNAEQPAFVVPLKARPAQVMRDYATMGVQHILSGVDHLLFVLGLLLLVTRMRRLVWTITAFTFGHSVTLALATLGFLRYPVDLAEFAIALSILVVAVELTRENTDRHWLRRRPWLAAGGFGLLHGMGFAGALLEVGLPPNDIPLALLCFNAGIEIGQLMFVAVMLALYWMWRRLPLARWTVLRWVPVYLIGIGSAYWCIERGSLVLL